MITTTPSDSFGYQSVKKETGSNKPKTDQTLLGPNEETNAIDADSKRILHIKSTWKCVYFLKSRKRGVDF